MGVSNKSYCETIDDDIKYGTKSVPQRGSSEQQDTAKKRKILHTTGPMVKIIKTKIV